MTSRRRRTIAAALVAASALLLSACQGDPDGAGAAERSAGSGGGEPSAEASDAPDVELRVSGHDGGPVPIGQKIVLEAEHGTLDDLRVVGRGSEEGTGPLPGKVSEDGSRWQAEERPEPGTRYVVTGSATRADGSSQPVRLRFGTRELSLAEQTYPSIAPLAGETVGVGMPVVVQFDVPVRNRAGFERNMSVRSRPAQDGSWHWISDREVHWRPKEYWQPGSRVRVNVDVNSVPAGGGVHGQVSRVVDFRVGDAVVSRLDVRTHTMKVHVNGRLARTMAVSAGKPGWETRSGTKVVMEKHRRKRMDAATIGVDEGDPEYYNLADVEYALRVTHSGEFLHAAPWSAGSQGRANVSHGCVGMSLDDAAWLYDITKRGDVVEVTGSSRQMTLTNGYGDWNASFRDYREGSALA